MKSALAVALTLSVARVLPAEKRATAHAAWYNNTHVQDNTTQMRHSDVKRDNRQEEEEADEDISARSEAEKVVD